MEKARIIVLTDIADWSREPDDAQSLVRLLLYSNEYDIEGLIPSPSIGTPITEDEGYITRIREVVEAYGKVQKNLKNHADGYPDVNDLLCKIKKGTNYVNMEKRAPHYSPELMERFRKEGNGRIENVGEGLSNEGSKLICDCIKSNDPRKLYISLWAGCGTLAQAIYDLEKELGHNKLADLLKNVEVYDIDGQDNCGAWIMSKYPELKWCRTDTQHWGFSETPIKKPDMFGENCFVGNLETVSGEWVNKNIQRVGPLGEIYPSAVHGLETDTPSFLRLIRNGLDDHEHQWYGGWGGRHSRIKSKNVPAVHYEYVYNYENQPFYMYRDENDTWYDSFNDYTMINSILAPLSRFREDYQNDMAARMQWSVAENYGDANHNPVAVVNGNSAPDAIIIEAKAGDVIELDASKSYDPDGDDITYNWYCYKEPGTYNGNIEISDNKSSLVKITVPEDAICDELHIICEVCDNQTPFYMKGYKRIIIKTGCCLVDNPHKILNDSELEYEGSWEYKQEQYGMYNDDVHMSSEPGACAIAKFTGRRIMLCGGSYRDCGIAKIIIDDKELSEEDFYSYIFRYDNKNNRTGEWISRGESYLYLSPYLSYGEHTLKVMVTGTKNCLSEGNSIIIDRVLIFE